MALDAGGGAGDRRERFTYMQVEAMWVMLSSHDSAPHYQALEGWRRSYELVLMHRTQVEKYKEKLITAWPPERNKAALSYIERLDHLIASLTDTYEASIANYTAYSSALVAMDDIKRKMDTLQQEHAANTVALAKHEEELRDRPLAYGKAIAPPPPSPPVAASRQEELRLQAVGLMTGLTAELATAQTSLIAPRPYTPLRIVNNDSESIGNWVASPTPQVPSSFSGRTASSSRSGSTAAKTVSDDPGTGKPGNSTPGKTPSVGPILGGTKQPLAPSPNTSIPPSPPTTFIPSPNLTDSFNLQPSQNPSQSTTFPRNPATNSIGLGTPPHATSSRGPTSPLHGGIIGGSPPMTGSPSVRGGSPSSLARSGPRINPIGGIIGQESAAHPGGRGTSRRKENERSKQWDPDDPWKTTIGIDSVLIPPPEQRIDPGPTIGGR